MEHRRDRALPSGGGVCGYGGSPEEDRSFRIKLRSDMVQVIRDQHQMLQDWACQWEQRTAAQLDEHARMIVAIIDELRDNLSNGSAVRLKPGGSPPKAPVAPADPWATTAVDKAGPAAWLERVAELDALGAAMATEAMALQSVTAASANAGKPAPQLKPEGAGEADEASRKSAEDLRQSGRQMQDSQQTLQVEEVVETAGKRRSMMPQWDVSESPFFNRFEKTTEKAGQNKQKKGVTAREKQSKGCLHAFAEGSFFRCLSTALVILNTIFIGIEVDADTKLALQNPLDPMPEIYRTITRAFAVCFVIELIVRIAAYRRDFLCGDDVRWNMLDAILVATQLVEEFADGANLSSMRVIRLARLVRTLRIIRIISFFKDLRMMVCCVTNSFLSFFWSGILLLLIMYLFTVLFMQGTAGYLREEYQSTSPGPNQDATWPMDPDDLTYAGLHDAISLHYKSLVRSLLSLLMSITGGADWYEVMRPLNAISYLYGALFALYIVVTMFGVVNVLTALFVDNALQIRDRDLMIHAETKKMDTFLQDMFELFQEADADQTNGMTKEEMFNYLHNDRVSAYMAGHCLDVSDASVVFELLDTNKSGVVETHEFVLGMARLKGQARCLDVMRIFSCFEIVQEQVLSLHHDVNLLRAACARSTGSVVTSVNVSQALA